MKKPELRFFLSEADRKNIDKLTAEEHPVWKDLNGGALEQPESLIVSFRTKDGTPAPQIHPIFSGASAFSSMAPAELPKFEDVNLSNLERISKEARTGTLRVAHASTDSLETDTIPAIGHAPTLSWYSPIVLTVEFLVKNFRERLPSKRTKLIVPADGKLPQIVIEAEDTDWAKYAIWLFLRGNDMDLGVDDGKLPMPEILLGKDDGMHRLVVTLGMTRSRLAREALKRENTLNVSEAYPHPAHPSTGLIPVRAFLQQVKPRLGIGKGDAHTESIIGSGYIDGLRESLNRLGFGIAKAGAKLEADTYLNWAIREFQIYAKRENIASKAGGVGFASIQARTNSNFKVPLERPPSGDSKVKNGSFQYPGPVSGCADQETRGLIALWDFNELRCPVIVGGDAKAENPRVNLWMPKDAEYGPIFARDVSGHLGASDKFLRIGDRKEEHPRGGVGVLTAEFTPASVDLKEDGLNTIPGQQSTFKVIRAAAEFECDAWFDQINTWDLEGLSMGLVHHAATSGELGGLLALAKRVPEAFRWFEDIGLGTESTWPAKKVQGRYSADLGLQGDDGTFSGEATVMKKVYENYIRNWHLFYRCVTAVQTSMPLRRVMFDLVRFRLQNVLNTTLPAANLTIQEIATSELAIAMILRWHAKSPAHIVGGGKGNHHLNDAYEQFLLDEAKRRPDGTEGKKAKNGREERLIGAILAKAKTVNSGLHQNLDEMQDLPNKRKGGYKLDKTLRTLDATAGSFQFWGDHLGKYSK